MKILVVSGSSGGHIFPAVGLIEALIEKDKNLDILLVLPERNITEKINHFGYKINCIAIRPFSGVGFILKNSINGLRFLKGSWESLVILLRFKPDIVIAFGSIVCVPIVVIAYYLKIRTWIHEQNVVAGRANMLLARFADRIAISFKDTEEHLKDYKDKLIFTGNPMRRKMCLVDKKVALDFFGFSPDKFTILVMGGSQGSQRINRAFLKAISAIVDLSKIQVIHISGDRDSYLLKHSYQDLNVHSRLFSFLESMHYAYSACDLVISRAGAGTIRELIYFKIPAIIIPYPFAYAHQLANARVLEKAGCAQLIKDSELDSGKLKNTLEDLIINPDRVKIMRTQYDQFKEGNANGIFAESVLALN